MYRLHEPRSVHRGTMHLTSLLADFIHDLCMCALEKVILHRFTVTHMVCATVNFDSRLSGQLAQQAEKIACYLHDT